MRDANKKVPRAVADADARMLMPGGPARTFGNSAKEN